MNFQSAQSLDAILLLLCPVEVRVPENAAEYQKTIKPQLVQQGR